MLGELRAVVRHKWRLLVVVLSWREIVGWEAEDLHDPVGPTEEDFSENSVPVYGPPLVELEMPMDDFYDGFYDSEKSLAEWVESRLPKPIGTSQGEVQR